LEIPARQVPPGIPAWLAIRESGRGAIPARVDRQAIPGLVTRDSRVTLVSPVIPGLVTPDNQVTPAYRVTQANRAIQASQATPGLKAIQGRLGTPGSRVIQARRVILE
jgi:hypothetical protein